ncbi:MAG: proline hydroxylase [Candidatus Marinimicrobia bacterium]|nr:proline hydroxylase [Candidatus Neomarinimicrobiota bacterium]
MIDKIPYLLNIKKLETYIEKYSVNFRNNKPFSHVIIDDFLEEEHINFLSDNFPSKNHQIWLDWKKRSPNQYGKLGPGNSEKFHLLNEHLQLALIEFNSSKFISFLEKMTSIERLIPDPYFTGGGFHQILKGGFLDVHTDFNYYKRLNLFRRINVLIYINEKWLPEYNGELELWSGNKQTGRCELKIEPIKNRCVIFNTNKSSFHGHPSEWNAPDEITRRSLALYYYTSEKEDGQHYDELTDFQNIITKQLPKT